jgi:hypothetical protein
MDKRLHSGTGDVYYFGGSDCDTNHYLVVAKVTQRLSVSKRTAQNFDMGRLNIKKLNEMEVKEDFQVKLTSGLQVWKTSMMMIMWTSSLGK